MDKEIRFTYNTVSPGRSENVGNKNLIGETVANAKCPFCNHRSTFKQISVTTKSPMEGSMVGLSCNHCDGIISASIDQNTIYPSPNLEALDGLPDKIDEYYNEGIRCLDANAPNGAATVFRKVIHAVCVYYDLSEPDDNDSFYDMIQTLADENIITESLRQSLLGVKDAGNDGAHINDNDPNIDQARNMKEMIDAVLTATVIADKKVDQLREEHPNPHQE